MSGETIRLVNKTGAILVLNLPHGLVPEAASMSVVGVRAHDLKSGERKVSLAKKGPVSGSVTILAGKFADVPRSALRAPEVQAALNAKRIAAVDRPAAPPTPPPTPPTGGGAPDVLPGSDTLPATPAPDPSAHAGKQKPARDAAKVS